MKLVYNAFSPFAFKVRVVLDEKGIDFERRELRSGAERDQLRRLNPRDEVPALEDGGVVIYDSTVICEYLDPFFSRTHVHWRNDRVEAAVRAGLGSWLLAELNAGRAFFSPVP